MKENEKPLEKLKTLEDDWHHDDNITNHLKRKINTFDSGMKTDFKDLESKIVRNIKRN